MKTWSHPQLGSFKFDEDCDQWTGICEVPAFRSFTWETNPKMPGGKYKLSFECSDGAEPSAGAIRMASTIIANQAQLASLVPVALWNDFNGRGPKSGMWWHGDLDQVAQNLEHDDRPRPGGPADLLSAMRFGYLLIHEGLHEYQKAIAELIFWAVFEEEHGVGILTDGKKILGAGFANDACPYK